MTTKDPAELLSMYKAKLDTARRGRALAESVGLIWEYLAKTPGELRPYSEFRSMLGVKSDSAAFNKLCTLTRNGVIRRTSSRKGVGGGVGFVCEWLEERRCGEPLPDELPLETARNTDIKSVRSELNNVERLAEQGVQSMRLLMGEDSRLGLAMVETLREIQASVSRAMVVLADKR